MRDKFARDIKILINDLNYLSKIVWHIEYVSLGGFTENIDLDFVFGCAEIQRYIMGCI